MSDVSWRVIHADVLCGLKQLPDQSVQCCVTSPPYWGLRDYGHDGQIGLEPTPDAYVARMVEVFREVWRVLTDDGTLWLNLGDSYAGYWGDAKAKAEGRASSADTNGWTNGFAMNKRPSFHQAFSGTGIKAKDLIGIPWRVAFALQADGWYLRQDIIWHKPNPMPESVRDRCTKAHEYVFLLTKSERYFYDAEAVSEPVVCQRGPGNKKPLKGVEQDAEKHRSRAGLHVYAARWQEEGSPQSRNRRSVWTITTQPYSGAHFAVMPPDLVEPCVLAGSASGDMVCDPFAGSGTTGAVAVAHGRSFVGIELNAAYVKLARERIGSVAPLLAQEELGIH